MKIYPFISLLVMLICSGSNIAKSDTSDITTFQSSVKPSYIVELYTSEGCSSCPPAEKALNSYLQHRGLWSTVFPLAFHVDYWDYLGWRDPYASALHSKRQRQYAKTGQVRGVYTPAFIVNGEEVGPRLKKLLNPVESEHVLTVSIDKGVIDIQFHYLKQKNTPLVSRDNSVLTYHVALLGLGLETAIERGENRGRRAQHEFVVLNYFEKVEPDYHWRMPMPKTAHHPKQKALVVWVTQGVGQRPLQITGGLI